MTLYRLDQKGRVVSIDGEVLVPSARRRFAHRIRRECRAFMDEAAAVAQSRR